ncbi:hypothetical protein [Paraburkholderia sp. SIMBA_054]|uniref:hypothetical protein n=1 Tax=Paraburkholderia sp. SIMBA_054 TaxID=3085795 RepID=UPI00397823BB
MSTDTHEPASLSARLLAAAKSTMTAMFPTFGAVTAAKDFISEAVAQNIREEACAKARTVLADAHRTVITNILWQNGLLMLAMLPVYLLRSAWPFYLAYAGVLGYTLYSVFQSRRIILRLCATRSVTQTLAAEVFEAIDAELQTRGIYQRKVVEYLGPDLKRVAQDAAVKLRPDVLAAAFNMGVTLFLSFVAFRLFVIPMLEHRALMH